VVPMSLEGPDLARRCRDLADNKKAGDPVLLDLREVGGPCEFFLIVSGESEPHLKAIAGEVEKGVREESGRKPFRTGRASPISKRSRGRWKKECARKAAVSLSGFLEILQANG